MIGTGYAASAAADPGTSMSAVAAAIPLTQADHGCDLEITGYCQFACGTLRLAELGLCPGRVIRVLSGRDPVICQVANGRVGLSREVADDILVRTRASDAPVPGCLPLAVLP